MTDGLTASMEGSVASIEVNLDADVLRTSDAEAIQNTTNKAVRIFQTRCLLLDSVFICVSLFNLVFSESDVEDHFIRFTLELLISGRDKEAPTHSNKPHHL